MRWDTRTDGRSQAFVEPARKAIALAARHEHHRGGGIDADADQRHHDDRRLHDRLGLAQPLDGLPGDAAYGHQQQERVGERGQDRGPPEPVGAPFGGTALGQGRRAPGHYQAEHVAEIVAGIGHERSRIGGQTPAEFNEDKNQIGDDSNEQNFPAVGQGMVMMIVMIVVPVVPVRGMGMRMIVMSGHEWSC